MMPAFSAEAASRGVGALRLLAGGLVPAFLLGLVQAAIAVTALHWGVGITVQDLPLMFGLAGLTSLVFVALNHGFGALFGPVGKFVALVLIALQISGAGGTYPVATLPPFFQAIHPYLPITHAVDAFRAAIGGGWIDPRGDLPWRAAGWRSAWSWAWSARSSNGVVYCRRTRPRATMPSSRRRQLRTSEPAASALCLRRGVDQGVRNGDRRSSAGSVVGASGRPSAWNSHPAARHSLGVSTVRPSMIRGVETSCAAAIGSRSRYSRHSVSSSTSSASHL